MMSEKEVKSLVKKKDIPYQTIHEKICFNKQQIVEWALTRNIPINVSGHARMEEYQIKSLGTVLDQSSFHYNCDFDKNTYIEQMVGMLDLEMSVDKEIIVQLLKNREELMSTAIGNGIALPHPRIPLMVGRDKPLLAFFFPAAPLDLKSLDGKPVHTIILLICQTIKQHLSLLAHLSYLLLNDSLKSALEKRLSNGEILDIIKALESRKSE
jgi:nitrogen PTS system EIIA component